MDHGDFTDSQPKIDDSWEIHPKWNKVYRVIERFPEGPTSSSCKSYPAVIIYDGEESICVIDTLYDGIHVLTIPHASSKYEIVVYESSKWEDADSFFRTIVNPSKFNGGIRKKITEISPPYNENVDFNPKNP